MLFIVPLLRFFQYLEWRFSKGVRTLASACFILQMVIGGGDPAVGTLFDPDPERAPL